jgi:hypothetical protein
MPIPTLRITFPSFSSKTVNPSVKLPGGYSAFLKSEMHLTVVEIYFRLGCMVGRWLGMRIAPSQAERIGAFWKRRLRESEHQVKTLEAEIQAVGPVPQRNDPKYLERAYGPLATQSAQGFGAQVAFRDASSGQEQRGTLIWIRETDQSPTGLLYSIEASKDPEKGE